MLKTPAEYLENESIPEMVFVHGLDMLEHVLKKDNEHSFLKNEQGDKARHVDWLNEELAKHEGQDNFEEITEELGEKKAQFKEYADEEGEFDVDAYLNGEELVFKQEEKLYEQGKGHNLLIDMSIPFGDRGKKDMAKRHESVYNTVIEREAQCYPTRVMAAFYLKSEEIKNKKKGAMFFIVIKDYEDPIFPGLWGALKNNETANSFLNSIASYFIGLFSGGNGRPSEVTISKWLDEEFTIVQPSTGFLKE